MANSPAGRNPNQYRIVGQIGRGGMATVYKAYQPGLEPSTQPFLLSGVSGMTQPLARGRRFVANVPQQAWPDVVAFPRVTPAGAN